MASENDAELMVAGENDLAHNPFDLRADHGPSPFDATHRFVLSGSYALPSWRGASNTAATLLNGSQLSTIANLSTGAPFTVYDIANASLQGSAPEITGFYSSRPNLISNPNANQPHTANQWVSAVPAAQSGNAGRPVWK